MVASKTMITKLYKWTLGLLGAAVVSIAHGQAPTNIIPEGFFGTTDKVRQPNDDLGSAVANINLAIAEIALYTDLLKANPYTGDSEFNGAVTWTHSAKGLIYAYASLLFPLLEADIFAQTHTNGNSLVFSRHLEVDGAAGPVLDAVLSNVLGLSVINEWSSTAHIEFDAPLTAGQYYSIQFAINTNGGLPVEVISGASFSVASGGTVIHRAGGDQLLDLLGLIGIGTNLSNGMAEFTFLALTDLDSLDLTWTAATVADVSLLGTPEENQHIMSFSNLTVTPVPEPASALLFLIGGALILRRSRHQA